MSRYQPLICSAWFGPRTKAYIANSTWACLSRCRSLCAMVLGCNRMSTQSHPKVLFVPQFLLFACNLRIFSGGIVAPQPRLRYSSSALRFFPKARQGRFMMKSSTSTCSLPPRLVLLVPNLGLCVAALVCIGAPSILAYHARRVSSWLKNWVWTCWPPCLLLT